jgi:hypothetical protein
MIEPALRGLTRGGASVLLVTVLPGGFLLHLSSGVVLGLGHGYVWEKGSENKEAIWRMVKGCLANLQKAALGLPLLSQVSSSNDFPVETALDARASKMPAAPSTDPEKLPVIHGPAVLLDEPAWF